MIIKTQAIALKISPFSETSRVVAWLTADHGKIATIIKGAQRPRNGFLGQYDLFYTCELLFYLRLFQGLHIVKECFPLKHRSALRTYWPGTACASYFAGLAAKIAPFYAPQSLPACARLCPSRTRAGQGAPARELGQGNIYTLLESALDFFSAEQNPPAPGSYGGQAPPSPHGFRRRPDLAESRDYGGQAGGQALETGLFWFELKLLGAMGFAPRLNACLRCHRPLPLGSPRRSLATGGRSPDEDSPVAGRGSASIAFSAARGGVFCGPCAGQNRETSGRIAPDSLALLRFWQSSQKIHAARNAVCDERQLKDAGIILGGFLQYHLETENTGREIALAILRKHRELLVRPTKVVTISASER